MFPKRKSERVKKSVKYKNLDELVLKNAKLRFCPEQLQNLNFIFQKRLQHSVLAPEKSLVLAKSVTERLVQRLVCGVGILDSRFSSKFLIQNDHNNSISDNTLAYMVRLDNLSTPCLYKNDPRPKYTIMETATDYPPGYARLRLHTSCLKNWSDYTNSNGYLRRDKIQARFIELLAQAASMETPNSPLHVDDSILCGVPGKIVDPATLEHILKVPSSHHIFYGPGGNVPRFPDPRDFRLAIVDEPNGIKIKIEFLSPTLSNISMTVQILVAIGIDAWPSSTDFPARVSLGHSDCLLFHQAAQTGMYLVGYGVQSSAWQIRLPAAEYVLLNHYGSNSNMKTILDILYDILEDIDNIRNQKKISYKILNNYILLSVLLEELEENSINPSADLINWSPMYLSTHILKLLDKLINRLHLEHHPNYFFKKCNLLVNPGHLSDDDYVIEANNVKSYMLRLFDESLMSTKGNIEFSKMYAAQESEMILLFKWKELIDGLLPPSGTRGRRFCFAGSKNKLEIVYTQYTARQLDYIGLLLKSMLHVKQNVQQSDSSVLDGLNCEELESKGFLEDVIYILVTIMDQARDQYLNTQISPAMVKNKSKIKLQYNNYSSKLVEVLRKDKEINTFNFEDDLILVKVILKWLYKAIDQNKRYLAPILRPYLQTIFATSHSLSWHLDAIRQKLSNDELMALGSFANLVNSGKISPAQGLLDSFNKNWIWAKNMLDMVQKHTLRVIFISDRGKVYRHILSLPSYQNKIVDDGFKTLESPKGNREIRRQKTMPNRNYFNSILKETNVDQKNIPQHEHLKANSPLSLILSHRHRRGDHRGCGDIFKALLSMQKLNVVQDVAAHLPQEDQVELMELIHSMQTVKNRRAAAKKWTTTMPHTSKNRISSKSDSIQKYTPKEESAGIRIKETKTTSQEGAHGVTSLIKICRAARIKEDNNVFLLQDSFKVKSLNKRESFKY